MARKVFISFLGTTNYVSCNYYYENPSNVIKDVRFIQEASLRLKCSSFEAKDRVLIFATDDAEKKNWSDNGQPEAVIKSDEERVGLKSRLKALKESGYAAQIPEVPIWIPEGFSEKQVWETFQIIFDKLEDGDEVYLDITHSFRFIPMLTIVLLDYAKFQKKIKVKSISYGAFEYLGPAFAVRNIKLEDRNAPIIEIASFSDLQDWTDAISDFVEYGNTGKFSAITKNEYPSFNKALSNVSNSFRTNRGRRIMDGDIFKALNSEIKELSNLYPPPLEELVSSVKSKISGFSENQDILNGFRAVKWCIEHQLIQQGITILEESIFTYFLFHFMSQEKKDIKSEFKRNAIKSSLYVFTHDKPIDEWRKPIAKGEIYHEVALALIKGTDEEIRHLYKRLETLRNDINHSGVSKDNEPEEFMIGLEEVHEGIVKVLSLKL